jgi:hypothetical protein
MRPPRRETTSGTYKLSLLVFETGSALSLVGISLPLLSQTSDIREAWEGFPDSLSDFATGAGFFDGLTADFKAGLGGLGLKSAVLLLALLL